MILLHIIAGLLGLASGAVALSARKGAKLHRKSGMIFVYAMMVLSGSGAVMAVTLQPNRINVIAGVITFYLVSTAFLAVRRTVAGIRWIDLGAMLVALTVGIASVSFGLVASGSATGTMDGMPAPGYFVFGALALLAALGDIRMILARGIQGKNRIVRHLWRMCLALFVATSSFFLGQADEFPEPLRTSGLLALPVLVVVLTTLYWLVRVRFMQWYRRVWQQVPADVSAMRPAAEAKH